MSAREHAEKAARLLTNNHCEFETYAEQARTEALVAIALALTEPPKSPEPRTVVLGR